MTSRHRQLWPGKKGCRGQRFAKQLTRHFEGNYLQSFDL